MPSAQQYLIYPKIIAQLPICITLCSPSGNSDKHNLYKIQHSCISPHILLCYNAKGSQNKTWSNYNKVRYKLASSRVRKIAKDNHSFIMCVHLSARNNSAPTGRIFTKNFSFEYSSKVCPENSSSVKIGQKYWALYIMSNVQFWSYPAQFFLEWKVFQTKL